MFFSVFLKNIKKRAKSQANGGRTSRICGDFTAEYRKKSIQKHRRPFGRGCVRPMLPLITKLNGVTFNGRQDTLAASVVGDSVLIKHNPNDEYPNTVEVFNVALDASCGVIPSDNGEKLLKKYKAGCKFNGVITSIYGGGGGKNYGVDIMILSQA